NTGTSETDLKTMITASTEVDPKHGAPLKLIECINIAKEKSPAILESAFNLDSQASKIEQSKSPLKPQVSLSGQESWQSSNTKVGSAASSNSNASGGSLSVSANKVVYDGNKLKSGVAIAEKNEQVASFNHKKLILDTLLKVAQNYYNAIINIKLEIVQKETYRSAVMHEELAAANFNVGISPKTDLIRAQANTYENKFNLISAINAIKKSKLALELSMGMIDTGEIWLLDSLVCDTFDIELNASVEKAMNVRQEIAAQKEAIEILKLQKKQIAAERAPQFSIGSTAGKSFENSQKTDRGSFSINGSVSLSLYNGGLTANKLAEIDLRLKAEEQKYNSLVLSVKYDVTQAYLTLTETFEKIEVAKKSVESAELSKKLTEEQYKVGLATMVDLLDSEVAYSRALTNMIQAQGSFLIARCSFKRSIGDDEFYK
ncbi:MAG TPA: TolC family protein, partial [Candidatus Wallbacteria bacterium]|nr:TolC family protein [Candidatus Wallbacteria bacterium]